MNGTFAKITHSGADAWIPVYTVPASGVLFQTLTISLYNNTGVECPALLAVSNSSSPSAGDVFAGPTISVKGTYDYSCRPFGPGETIFVKSPNPGLNVHVFGLTKGA